MGKRIIIVGGVAGGASAAARLRRLDEDAEITIYERGEYISYANCGLPYHLGDVIASRDALLLNTPEGMGKKYNVAVQVRHEVVAIHPEAHTVEVKDLEAGVTTTVPYDKLVLATGSSPIVPPLPGIDHPKIMPLWTVPDMDQIKSLLGAGGAGEMVVVGGGFIGLEVAENLREAGVIVHLVEKLNQVMAPLDLEMAKLVQGELVAKGVDLHLSMGVTGFENIAGKVKVLLEDGTHITADGVVLAIGVRPNNQLAVDAGLAVGTRGGIITDGEMVTTDPDIYALGDAVEVVDRVDGSKGMIPLAGPANKQGRIVADNLAGGKSAYAGSLGTAVAKVFDLTAASTGHNEKRLMADGLVKGEDYETIIITQNSHAGYYPGATPLTLKLLFTRPEGRILGAQIVGRDGVDKRIDTISVVLGLGGSIDDLTRIETAYAPPYSSAKDPVNMAGFVAENVLTGRVAFTPWDILETHPEYTVLDVREDAECMVSAIPGAIHIPLGQLRDRLQELGEDRSAPVVVFCAIGVRGYNAARILAGHGFTRALVYPGGMKFYRATHYEALGEPQAAVPTGGQSMSHPNQSKAACIQINCSGLQCPGPIMKVFEAMGEMADGDTLEVQASDPGFTQDIAAWCRRTGNTLLETGEGGGVYTALLQKGRAGKPVVKADALGVVEGKTMVVFSGDLDKVLASFIIANGAAAMGRPVTMFFTFWGLNALRKPQKQAVKKSMMEKMFGVMMPRGTQKLKLSKMNMLGMGTAMMKKIMKNKNVDSLETLMQKAMDNGVKLVACTMSMDVMGIKKEELIDGITYAGVGAYLGDAEESNVNLFI